MLIQYLLIFLILVILYKTFKKWRGGNLNFGVFIFWLFFWLLAGAVVIKPESTNFVANIFGVGRGADLVVYLSIIVIFYIIFQLTVKMEKIERNMTQIVRKIAVDEIDDSKEEEKNKEN